MTRPTLLAALFALVLPIACPASITQHRDGVFETSRDIPNLSFKSDALLPHTFAHGTPVCSLSLRNDGIRERTFSVNCNLGSSTDTQRIVTLGPGNTATLSFVGHQIGDDKYSSSGRYLITELTPGSDRTKTQYWHTPYGYGVGGGFNMLVDGSISAETLIKSLDACSNTTSRAKHSYSSRSYGSREVEFNAYVLANVSDWPADHRIYSTYGAVVVTPELMTALPQSVRNALDDYRQLGGAVFEIAPAQASDLTMARTIRGELIAAYTRLTHGRIPEEYFHAYNSKVSVSHLLERIPLTVDATLPIAALIALLGLFACVFVPTTVWLCAKRNRRLALLFILPGASAVLAIFVGLIALINYGVTPTQRLQSVTLLNQSARRAYTRGQFALFSPRDVTDRIAFPSDTSFRLYNVGDALQIEPGDPVRLSGSWIKPLTATFFDVTRISRQSEKLEVKSVGPDSVTVHNLLGATITKGVLRHGGLTYRLNEIKPGEQVTLQGSASSVPPANTGKLTRFLNDEASGFGADWPKLTKALEDAESLLSDKAYAVHLDGPSLFPPPLGTTKAKGQIESWVIGTLAEESK